MYRYALTISNRAYDTSQQVKPSLWIKIIRSEGNPTHPYPIPNEMNTTTPSIHLVRSLRE